MPFPRLSAALDVLAPLFLDNGASRPIWMGHALALQRDFHGTALVCTWDPKWFALEVYIRLHHEAERRLCNIRLAQSFPFSAVASDPKCVAPHVHYSLVADWCDESGDDPQTFSFFDVFQPIPSDRVRSDAGSVFDMAQRLCQGLEVPEDDFPRQLETPPGMIASLDDARSSEEEEEAESRVFFQTDLDVDEDARTGHSEPQREGYCPYLIRLVESMMPALPFS